jgi:hypothetical protein
MWFRWWEGTVTDPKFRLIAHKAGQPLAVVVAVWAMVLENASHAEDEGKERGDISPIDFESADFLLGVNDGTTEAVLKVFEEKSLIEDNRVTAWEKRQPRREREDNSSRRVREFRQRQRERGADVTPCNAMKRPETDVTPRNAPEQSREEHIKDIKDKTFVRSDERTMSDNPPENSDPPAENPSEDGGARTKDSGKGIEYTAEFEEFWEAYPRRVRKRDAFKHWTPSIAKGAVAAEIVAAAKAYAAAMRYLERAPDMIMHPQTFIMSERWREWLPPDGQEYLDARETYRTTRRVRQEGQKYGQPPQPQSREEQERQSQRDRESEEYFRREQDRIEREFGGDCHDDDGNREASQ